jgi:hypothetical protein
MRLGDSQDLRDSGSYPSGQITRTTIADVVQIWSLFGSPRTAYVDWNQVPQNGMPLCTSGVPSLQSESALQ